MSGLSGQVVGSSGMDEERYDHMDRKSFDSIRIEIAGAEDLNEIRKLWKQSFDDQDAYMDYYFSSVAIRNQIFVAKNGSKIISMVHLNPYTLAETTAGVTAYKRGGYVVGVATVPEFRKQGIMSMLMKYVLSYAAENNYDYIYLMPEKEIYYKGLGFAPVVESGFYNITDLKPEKNDYELCGLEDITDEQLQSFSVKLTQRYDLFVPRTRAYLEDLGMECQSLFGDVYIIKDENEIAAVYGIMYDGDRAEIVQYCTVTGSIDPLLYGICESDIPVFSEVELFGTYTDHKMIKKGHGIMFYEPYKECTELYRKSDHIFINEVV